MMANAVLVARMCATSSLSKEHLRAGAMRNRYGSVDMTQEQIDRANKINRELQSLRWILHAFSDWGISTNAKPRLGRVKRRKTKCGWALYTINDTHSNPVEELVIPDAIKQIIYTQLRKYEESLKKELERL